MNKIIVVGFLIAAVIVIGFSVYSNLKDKEEEKQFELESNAFFDSVSEAWRNLPENWTAPSIANGGLGGNISEQSMIGANGGTEE